MFEAICLPQAWKVPGSNIDSHITQFVLRSHLQLFVSDTEEFQVGAL